MYTDTGSGNMYSGYRGMFGPPAGLGYPQAQYFGAAGPDKPPSAMAFHGKKVYSSFADDYTLMPS